MITVEKIHISPVKSLALTHPDTVDVSWQGVTEDRRLFLVDDRGRLLTQRHFGRLVQVQAEYHLDPERLTLRMPGGDTVEGPIVPGEPTANRIFGRRVMGNAVPGEWDAALSDFCGATVRLVRAQQPGQCYDEFPISLLSTASLERLGENLGQPSGNVASNHHAGRGAANRIGPQAGAKISLDSRRFRPNFLLRGCGPHEEDDWIGEAIRIGDGLQVRVVARDPRCAITAHDPDTGETDLNTPEIIAGYRPTGGTAYFGVYGIVEHPGRVAIGDTVTLAAGVPS